MRTYHFAEDAPRVASLGQRAAALAVDVGLVFMAILAGYAVGVAGREQSATDIVRTLTLTNLLVFPTFLAYFTILEGVWGTTVGKRLVGIRVDTLRNFLPPGSSSIGAKVGLYDAFLRNLLRFLWMVPLLAGDALSLTIGILILGVDVLVLHRSELDQRIGDVAASTVVTVR